MDVCIVHVPFTLCEHAVNTPVEENAKAVVGKFLTSLRFSGVGWYAACWAKVEVNAAVAKREVQASLWNQDFIVEKVLEGDF